MTSQRRLWHAVVFAAVTPLLEKNVLKTLALDTPVVFSMSRVMVLAFGVALLRQIWTHAITGWPEATLAIAIVLATPILGALERVKPADVVEFAKTLVDRFGIGDVPQASVKYEVEPHKFDDHREDT